MRTFWKIANVVLFPLAFFRKDEHYFESANIFHKDELCFESTNIFQKDEHFPNSEHYIEKHEFVMKVKSIF